MKTKKSPGIMCIAQLLVCTVLFVVELPGQTISNCVYTANSVQNSALGTACNNPARYLSPVDTSITNKRVSLSFVENRGQVTDQDHNPRTDIEFRISAANGMNIFIGNGAIHYQFSKTELSTPSVPGDKNIMAARTFDMYRVDVELIGANKHAKIIKEQKQDYYENYRFTTGSRGEGNDAVAHAYNKIIYKDVYPHIDWILYVNSGQLKHGFVVRQGGRVADIKLKYGGVTDLKIDARGNLIASIPQGIITENAPCTYQKDGKIIRSSFKLEGDILSYETGSYDGGLIIDPILSWATYYGGNDFDEGNAIATDDKGNVYMAGRTYSTSGIATSGAHQVTFGGYADAYLVKFNSSGVRQWATYYGGSDFDEGFGVATDGDGNVYMTGQAWSTSGIATPGAFQSTYGGNGNAFLAKFNRFGVRQWATYFGINGASGAGLATDRWGNVYMTGFVTTPGIATSGAHQTTFGGAWDAFLVKFNSAGARQWATYYGGSGVDFGNGIATDQSGDVYVGGLTSSTSAIATHHAFMSTYGGGSYDFYLVKFNKSGVRKWATYYGGSGDDQGYSVAADGNGYVYIAGITTTPGIATPGAHETTYKGTGYNALLVKFDEHGTRKWATYYGGNGASGSGVATDCSGNVYMTGATFDTVGVATPGAHQAAWAGGFDAYLVKFSNWGMRQWATYYGGTGDDQGHCIATDNSGNVYLAGITNSTSGIATPGAYQYTTGGISDAFLAKFGETCPVTHGNGHGCGHKNASTPVTSTTNEYNVYPNPSTGSFTVEIPAATDGATITIMDVNGRIIERRTVAAGSEVQKVQFNLYGISRGIHFVQVINGNDRYMTKVLLQ